MFRRKAFPLVLAIFTHFNTSRKDFDDRHPCQIARQRIVKFQDSIIGSMTQSLPARFWGALIFEFCPIFCDYKY